MYEHRCDERLKLVVYVFYYELIKREVNVIVKIKTTYECRWDERLKTKAEEFTRHGYTGFLGGLEHLKVETRLIDEKFANVYESRKLKKLMDLHSELVIA